MTNANLRKLLTISFDDKASEGRGYVMNIIHNKYINKINVNIK